jgi:superfamily II DNA or RNA helicase
MSNNWFRKKNPIGHSAAIEDLKRKQKVTIIYDDEKGTYIRPGSIPYLQAAKFELEVINNITYPEPKPTIWLHEPKFKPYPHQIECVEQLIKQKHGNIEISVGSGKAFILANLARNLGQKTIIMVPSCSTFNEMLEKFEYYFGKNKVGSLGDGKRNIKDSHLFYVCISKSLTMLKTDSKEYSILSKAKVFLADEAHLCPAATLEKVCHAPFLDNCVYRFFVSGTNLRGAGDEKMLEAIIGKTVFRMSTREATEKGILSPLKFIIVKTFSPSTIQKKDPLDTKRLHFLHNPNILKIAAKIANMSWNIKQENTLILVEDLPQISELIKLIEVPVAYVHGSSDRSELSKLGLVPTDNNQVLLDFNKGLHKVMIGTSCISVGVNLVVFNTINLRGSSSEVDVRQSAIGRSCRKMLPEFAQYHKEKNFCRVYDFKVDNNETLQRHLKSRLEYYKDVSDDLIEIEIKP